MKIENRMQLHLWREECKEKRQKETCRVLICGGTGCLAGGSDKIYARIKELTANMSNVTVKFGEEIAHVGLKMSGCHGFCEMGPLVRIEPYNYLYLKVKLEDCEEIFEKTILRGEPVTRLMYEDSGRVYETQEEIPFYAKQTRLVLKNCGHIDAEHIEDAMAVGAYEAFEKAVFEMTPEAVIKTVTGAGLRGRGGAGFPAGKKWTQVASQKEKIRYVVCNGDEGDPGAFMDRSVMEGDPHRMIEGMMLAAYAVQAQEGYIYVRAEYPLAVRRLQIAIAQAEEKGREGFVCSQRHQHHGSAYRQKQPQKQDSAYASQQEADVMSPFPQIGAGPHLPLFHSCFSPWPGVFLIIPEMGRKGNGISLPKPGAA